MVNDVSGNKEIFQFAQENKLSYVAMHSRGDPRTMLSKESCELKKDDFLKFFEPFFDYSSTFFDPGIGFGKSRIQDLQCLSVMMDAIPRERILIGASRKRFLDYLQNGSSDVLNREPAHLALINELFENQILWYRVHEVDVVTKFFTAKKKLKDDFQFSRNTPNI